MSPKTWLFMSLLLITLIACQPVRPVSELTPTPAVTPAAEVSPSALISSTETTSSTEASMTNVAIDESTVMRNCILAWSGQTVDVTSLPIWQQGEARYYQIDRKHTNTSGGQDDDAMLSTTPVTVTVLEAGDDSYVLEWLYGDTIFDAEGKQPSNPIYTFMVTPSNLRVEYLTNKQGQFVSLLNVDEVKEAYLARIIEYYALFTPKSEETTKILREQLSAQSDDFTLLAIKELFVYHQIYGHIIDSEAAFAESSFLNPFGGENLPSKLLIRPQNYGAETGCFEVTLYNRVDARYTFDIMEASLKLRAERSDLDTPLPDLEVLANYIIISDLGSVKLWTETGWIYSLNNARIVEFAGEGYRESMQIKAVAAP